MAGPEKPKNDFNTILERARNATDESFALLVEDIRSDKDFYANDRDASGGTLIFHLNEIDAKYREAFVMLLAEKGANLSTLNYQGKYAWEHLPEAEQSKTKKLLLDIELRQLEKNGNDIIERNNQLLRDEINLAKQHVLILEDTARTHAYGEAVYAVLSNDPAKYEELLPAEQAQVEVQCVEKTLIGLVSYRNSLEYDGRRTAFKGVKNPGFTTHYTYADETQKALNALEHLSEIALQKPYDAARESFDRQIAVLIEHLTALEHYAANSQGNKPSIPWHYGTLRMLADHPPSTLRQKNENVGIDSDVEDVYAAHYSHLEFPAEWFARGRAQSNLRIYDDTARMYQNIQYAEGQISGFTAMLRHRDHLSDAGKAKYTELVKSYRASYPSPAEIDTAFQEAKAAYKKSQKPEEKDKEPTKEGVLNTIAPAYAIAEKLDQTIASYESGTLPYGRFVEQTLLHSERGLNGPFLNDTFILSRKFSDANREPTQRGTPSVSDVDMADFPLLALSTKLGLSTHVYSPLFVADNYPKISPGDYSNLEEKAKAFEALRDCLGEEQLSVIRDSVCKLTREDAANEEYYHPYRDKDIPLTAWWKMYDLEKRWNELDNLAFDFTRKNSERIPPSNSTPLPTAPFPTPAPAPSPKGHDRD